MAKNTPLAGILLTSFFIFISLTDTHCADEMYKMNKSRKAGMLMNTEVSGGQSEGKERAERHKSHTWF